MRPKHLVAILALLILTVPASPAHAGGVVAVCDEAHLLAALAGGGSVTFACSGTITLTSPIAIAANTTLDGSGQAVTISGDDAVPVFTVGAGITFNLNQLTIADGNTLSFGAGIYNDGGTVSVSNSAFSGNSVRGYGGAIYSHGRLTVSNSTFAGNTAGWAAAIYAEGELAVSNSTFTGNAAEEEGGGILNKGALDVSASALTGNTAREGGGIFNDGVALAVRNSTFTDNSAITDGGGLWNGINSPLTIDSSTFSHNSAGYAGGGIINYYGTLTLSNSTFAGNSAAEGGGILNASGTLAVINSTFAGNSASNDGGGIHNYAGTATLKNTIVANSPAGGNCFGAISDGAGNLSFPDATCPGVNANPLLGPLQNNGGPTQTMLPGSGSAATNAGNDATCAAAPVSHLDQRGVTRPQGAHCDVGAVERQLSRLWLPLG